MGTYNDFLRSLDKPRLRRLYWVHGNDDTLRRETVRQIKESSGISADNRTTYFLPEDSESTVWGTLMMHPLSGDFHRLFVIHGAHRLEKPEQALDWLSSNQKTRQKTATVIFVSDDPDIPEAVKAAFVKSSLVQVIRCTLPQNDEDRDKRLLEILSAWSPTITRDTARYLIRHTSGDVHLSKSVLDKARLFPDNVLSPASVQALADPKIDRDFVWSLVACERDAAARMLPELEIHAVPGILSALSTHVEALGRMYESTGTIREIARRLDMKETYVRMLHPHAKFYPSNQVSRRTALLGRLDHHWQRGARVGIAEILVSQW